MNEFVTTLIKRRSMRAFKPEQIPEEMLNDILLSGLHAPSAINRQPVIMVVVQDKAIREKVVKMNQKVFNKFESDPYYGAPTIILVFGKKDSPFSTTDAAVALGNMYNAAYSMGLGECWINREKEMFETEEGKAFLKDLGITEELVGVGALSVGYPAKEFADIKEIIPNRVYRA